MAKRKMKQPWEAAAVIAELMRRAGSTRARISEKTLKLVAGRKRLETSIRMQITEDLKDYGYLIIQLTGTGATRGNAIIALSALHAAKPLKIVDQFDEQERKNIVVGSFDFEDLHDKLMGDDDDADGEIA